MKSLKRLFTFVMPYRLRFSLSMFFSMLYTLSRASQPFIIGLALSSLNMTFSAGVGVDFEYMKFIIILLITTSLFDAIGEYLANYLLADVVQSSMFDIRKTINQKLNKLPVSYIDSKHQGDLLTRITTDVDVVSNALQQGTLKIIGSGLTLVFSVIFMFIRAPFFALIALLIFPTCFFVYRYFIRKSQPLFNNLQNSLGDLNGFTTEHYTGYEVIQLYGQEEHVNEKFQVIAEEIKDTGFKSNFTASLISPILSHIANLFYIALFLLMGLTVLNGPLVIAGITVAKAVDVGILQSFIQYIWQSSGPIKDFAQLSNTFQAAAASLKRMFELLDAEEEEPIQDNNKIDLNNIKGNISFNHISFGYSEDNLLMKDIDVDVKSGDTVAVVGPTGAGKTTLINLLMRFYDVNGGSITIDGYDVKELSKAQSRSLFGMVLQDPWLYYTSVMENIRFGNLNATDQEVIEAAKMANVHHFIRTLPQNYETVLNEESSNVSQGQKQLITIARALVGNPQIVILDEATSSVDTRLELLIQKAMAKAMEGRTSFIIAHRLSTIKDADLILVMNQGSIVEQGNHEQLLAKGGMYKTLYNAQFSEEEEA
ncbi:MAG: ABC transporter ATP-binding protein [Erysipelotrichales bacterium]